MPTQTISSAYTGRLEALRNKHAIIESRIDDAQKRRYSGDFYLTQLKKQRLLIREEIETMSKQAFGQTSGSHASEGAASA